MKAALTTNPTANVMRPVRRSECLGCGFGTVSPLLDMSYARPDAIPLIGSGG
jgi:hypothetical protein